MKKVQVLMSSYNGENYIEEQIDSILSQRNVDVRLLVRDDGSSDKTLDILKKYEKLDNVRVIYGKNIGPYKSFLTLIDLSEEADYYAFSDQDDVWLDDKLSVGIKFIEDSNEKDIPILYCSALQRVDSSLRLEGIQSFPKLKRNIYSALTRERLAGCTFVINKNLKNLLVGSSDLNINYSHDSWTVLMCYACGGIVLFDETPHILFRRYGTNVSVDSGNLRKRIQHEFRYLNNCKNQRFDVVNKLVYFREDSIVEKEILNEVIHYKDSIYKTIKFALNRNLDCGIKASNLINRYVILRRCF